MGLGKNRLAKVQADLARIRVERRNELNVRQGVTAKPLMHQPLRRLAARIKIPPLNQGARAIADTDQRHLDLVHKPPDRLAFAYAAPRIACSPKQQPAEERPAAAL